MEPVSWLKAASDKLKKPDSRSRKEVYNRYFDNSQRLLRSVLVWVLNPNPLPFPYQQTHTLTCLFASPYPTYQRKAFTTTSLRLAYKNSIGVCVGACTGFLRLNLTCPMDTRAIVYKALFGPRFRVCKDCFDSLSDRRSDERCDGAWKTACELLYSQSRVGVVGSQLFRAQGIQKQASLTLFLLPL